MNFIIKWVLKSVVGRWVTGSLIALLLGGAVTMWHSHKNKLIDQGAQECIQAINKQTVIDLQDALAAERLISADLIRIAFLADEENALARARLKESESRVGSLLAAQEEQEKTDETYAAWSNTALPSGIADRLRSAQAGHDTGAVRDDSN